MTACVSNLKCTLRYELITSQLLLKLHHPPCSPPFTARFNSAVKDTCWTDRCVDVSGDCDSLSSCKIC